MTPFFKYDEQGRILHTGIVPEAMLALQGERTLAGRVDPAAEYVLDRTIVPRPLCPAVLTGTTLSGMPVPCVLHINDMPYQVTEDTVTLSFTNPGVYHLRVEAWPHQDGIFNLEQ